MRNHTDPRFGKYLGRIAQGDVYLEPSGAVVIVDDGYTVAWWHPRTSQQEPVGMIRDALDLLPQK